LTLKHETLQVGWFGSFAHAPASYKMTGNSAAKKMNFLLVPPHESIEAGLRICYSCLEDAQVDRPLHVGRPFRMCEQNHMDIGESFPAMDALNCFEEQILSPVQTMVRVYTLYATGQTELRGHISNVTQRGPQFVKEIPIKARDLPN
jgi:hypothetical protein